jgi:hypothetical protein
MLKTGAAFVAGLVIGTTLIAGAAAPQSRVDPGGTDVLVLRLYTIDRGRLDDFTNAWRAGVYPLRQRLGFEIPFAGKIPSTNQFVWLIHYKGSKTWQQKEDEYYGSDERKRLSPDPAQWIAGPTELMVTPVIAPK